MVTLCGIKEPRLNVQRVVSVVWISTLRCNVGHVISTQGWRWRQQQLQSLTTHWRIIPAMSLIEYVTYRLLCLHLDQQTNTFEPLYIQELSSSRDGRPFGDNRYGPKIGGVALWGSCAPSNTMSPGPRPTSVLILDPSTRLATIDMGRKLAAVPLWVSGGSWVSI